MRYKDYDGPVEKLVEMKLKEIEEKEHVRILHAVESGSRAWGFASPDSDYDVRFIYVRRPEDYLRLDSCRDVIEWELDETLDINGWDLQKTLRQYHRSNATLFEWANSPVVYRTTKEWEEIHRRASEYFSIKSALYHYYGTAKKNFLEYLQGDIVNYKKYFYVIRPVLACKWIEEHACPPPVLFSQLVEAELAESETTAASPETTAAEPTESESVKKETNQKSFVTHQFTLPEIRQSLDYLLEIKKKSPESGSGRRIEVLNHFIESEINHYKEILDHMEDDRKEEWLPLNSIFFDSLNQQERK